MHFLVLILSYMFRPTQPLNEQYVLGASLCSTYSTACFMIDVGCRLRHIDLCGLCKVKIITVFMKL
jgi:hypothetical protein